MKKIKYVDCFINKEMKPVLLNNSNETTDKKGVRVMNTTMREGRDKGVWRLNLAKYNAEELLETTARDILEEIEDLGLVVGAAKAVRDGARNIFIQKDVDIRVKATTKVVSALESGNETAQIHAIWLADICRDYVAQQGKVAFKLAA